MKPITEFYKPDGSEGPTSNKTNSTMESTALEGRRIDKTIQTDAEQTCLKVSNPEIKDMLNRARALGLARTLRKPTAHKHKHTQSTHRELI